MRSYNFTITPKQATEYAQQLHNDIDQNGEINQKRIVEAFMEDYAEKIGDWFEENVDWDQILEDDLDMRETIAEIEKAERGEY